MTSIDAIILDVPDPAAARDFYREAFGLNGQLRLRAADAPSTGFRGFTLSLIVKQPADADALIDAAVAGGATVLKPASKSMWGYGGVVQAPDGTIWKIATQKKKDSGPAAKAFEEIVLLLGPEDVKAAKRFYEEHGLQVGKSFGKYVEFKTAGKIGLGLYSRKALAKDAGVPIEGAGAHRIAIAGDAGTFTDPAGFAWEQA
jgi:uncharacterized glyoxalase superfamily protein PhnB